MAANRTTKSVPITPLFEAALLIFYENEADRLPPSKDRTWLASTRKGVAWLTLTAKGTAARAARATSQPLPPWPPPLTDDEMTTLQNLESELHREIRSRWWDGRWTLWGTRDGEEDHRQLPNSWRRLGCRIDPMGRTIMRNNVIFRSITVAGAEFAQSEVPCAEPQNASLSDVRKFTAGFVKENKAVRRQPTQAGLLKAWRDTGHRGHRDHLLEYLEEEVGKPELGRPPKVAGT
jgi:hypothetical protein